MKNHFLFPHSFRNVGLRMVIGGLVMAGFIFFSGASVDKWMVVHTFAIADSGILQPTTYFGLIDNSFFDEMAVISLVTGCLFLGFYRLKNEDEFSRQIRYESLIWAVYFNCAFMLFCTAFIFGTDYFMVMSVNLFSMLLFFVIRFHIKLYQLNKSTRDDE